MQTTQDPKAEIERLMTTAFFLGRYARSEEYRLGVRAILAYKLAGEPLPPLPYQLGSCEADAYFAGQDEGRGILKRKREKGGAA